MSLEEEHERLHHRGELAKFVVLVVVLLFSVLMIAALRPLIFEGIVPAILGWDRQPASLTPAASPSPAVETPTDEPVQPVIMTATPPAEAPSAVDTATPAATQQTYEVQVGDTLAEIATRFGVTVEAIAEANSLTNPNRIQAGDVLLIPTP